MIEIAKLDAVLEEIISRWGVPGLGVGIVQDSEIVYARCFGVQSLDTRAPVTQDSIFCVASIAKCFVASAVMQLVERGKVDLDAPLAGYLPYFRLDDDRYREMTIRQMLSHTAGMPDMEESEYDELVSHPEADTGAAERYVRNLSHMKMAAAPGERFFYSNIAYNVLGDLIAKISGQTFEDYMREHILRPAGMPESTFFYPEVPQDRLAVPHLRTPKMIVNPSYPYHRADAPASFLHTTVVDMCHWGIACLNGGVYDGQRFLSPASCDLMWTPVVDRGSPPLYESHGLGWVLGHFEGLKTVAHGGGGFGWADFFLLLPEVNQAFVIMSNEESSARSRFIRAVLNAMLGREPEVGKVSWMIPINQALQEGGIQAVYACYAQIKDSPEYFFDEYELVSLVYQLMSVKKFDLAIEVLKWNLQAFPQGAETYHLLGKLYLQKGEPQQAEEMFQQEKQWTPNP
jgi:CubicO group peptidase (beta-lactamase class C family)